MASSRSLFGLMLGSLLAVTALISSPVVANSANRGGKSPTIAVAPVATRNNSDCGPALAQLTIAQKQTRLQYLLQPVKGAKRGSFAEVSRLVTRAQWNHLSKTHRVVLAGMLRVRQSGQILPETCFAPGTDLQTIQIFEFADSSLSPFRIGGRWSQTATNTSVARGQGFTLTWSLVPDGTQLDIYGVTKTSILRQRTRTAFGTADDSVLLARFTDMFARYQELTGVRYTYEPNDDGVPINGGSAAGQTGVRGDIRISGASIDGASKILAFNYFPNNGDMVIDTDEGDASYTGNQFRQVIAHEHGHGLGLNHTCPLNQTKLMEPFVNGRFIAAQLDDIQGVQRNYGDTNETGAGNDTLSTATGIGTRSVGTATFGAFPSVPVTSGAAVPASYPYITTQKPLSIDGSDDADLYSFNVDAVGRTAAITLRPAGETYLEGAQNSDGTCSAGAPLNPKTFAALKVELLSANGQVMAQSGSGVAGQTQTISATGLAGTGPFYVRVTENGADAGQLYDFDVVVGNRTNSAPTVSVAISPTAPRANATLTATATASDADAGDTVTLSYQWQRNDVAIAGATSPTLNLNNVSGVTAGDVIRIVVTASDGNPPPATATDSVIVQEAQSLIVTTLQDAAANDNLTSLREAMAYAATLPGAQSVSFAPGLSGTIGLGAELPAVNKALTLTGQSGVEISGQDTVRMTTIGAAGALTATNLVFRNGRESSLYGGLFLINGGALTATDCVLRNSSALNRGGAVWAGQGATLNFTRCAISDNNAFIGGAFWLEGASATFNTCSIANNTTSNQGGAVYATAINSVNSAVVVRNCQVNSNTAASGGGIYIVGNGSTGSATNSTFFGNAASNGDGGAWVDGNQPTPFSNCSFGSNTATGTGGAIYDFYQLLVANCTFKGNIAPNGSAIGANYGTSRLQNNVFDATGQSASLSLNSTQFSSLASTGNNIASDGGGGFLTQTSDKINTAPGLNPLANNGGFVTTYSLAANSPTRDGGRDADAVDNNNNGNVTESLSAILVTDARGAGFPRLFGTAIDVGAFEMQSTNTAPTLEKGVLSASVNQAFSYPIVGKDADAGDTLTYARTSGDVLPGNVTVSSAGIVSGTPNATGTYIFNVTVTDNHGASATARFTLVVNSKVDGVAPILTHVAIPASLTRAALAAMTFSGTVQDIASTGVTPSGVKRVQIQLRNAAGQAYNGSTFTNDLSPYYGINPDAGGVAAVRNYARSLGFVPTTMAPGDYSFALYALDNAGNYSGALIPFTIVTSQATSSAPASVSGGVS